MSYWNKNLDQPMRDHLKNVYGSVASAMCSAALGAYIHYNDYFGGGFLSGLLTLLFAITLAYTRDANGYDDGSRFLCLNGLAFCTGISSGALIGAVWDIEPSLVISAIMYTCVIFTCFSLSAIFSREGSDLMLGGPVLSLVLAIFLSQIVNIFVECETISYMHLIFGLFMNCAFVLYDTHLIMKRFQNGDKDYVFHAVILFADVVDLFKHILEILTDKSRNRDDRS